MCCVCCSFGILCFSRERFSCSQHTAQLSGSNELSFPAWRGAFGPHQVKIPTIKKSENVIQVEEKKSFLYSLIFYNIFFISCYELNFKLLDETNMESIFPTRWSFNDGSRWEVIKRRNLCSSKCAHISASSTWPPLRNFQRDWWRHYFSLSETPPT